MKKFIIAAVLLMLVGVAVFLFQALQTSPKPAPEAPAPASDSSIPTSSQSSPAAQTTPNSPATRSQAATPEESQSLAARAGQYIPPGEPPTNLPPATVVENLRRIIHQYGEMFGGNPVGTNPEITAALMGKNPKKINFLANQPGVRVNADGAMIDPWGTPYFFHQLSGSVTEIHSAGPDKIMWTSDDLVSQ